MIDAAAVRVWLTTGGVALGIVASRYGVSTRAAFTCATAGLLCLCFRRVPAVALVGVLLLGAGLSAARPVVMTDGPGAWGGAPATAYREALTDALGGASHRSAGLLAGLTIGDTSGIDFWTSEMFRRSGLAHLVAVSGSNVAMVLAAVAVMTVRLPLVVRGGIGAVALAAYVMVVGPEPSVLRAAGMGVVGLIAYIWGRQAASLNSLGIALIGVLAFKPDLLFAIGLHLSAAATLGIVLWSRSIEERLVSLPGVLRAPIAITLSAQIAVAPLLIVAFERFSLVAPIANLLAAPAVPPATLIGLSSGVAGLVWPSAGRLLGAVAGPFAGWILWVSDETGGWSWASVDVPSAWGWVTAVPVGAAMLRAVFRRPAIV